MILQSEFTIYILVGVCVLLIAWIIRLEIKFKHLVVGPDSKSIEDSIHHLNREVKGLNKFQEDTVNYLTSSEKRLQNSIRAVETVRFNPFKGAGEGGNQSFATAFISEKGDGVVFSSLYSRDRVNVFAKGIANSQSEFELTAEEKEAIKRAKEKTVLK
ncbi:MAG: DUF4446 family protein [Candidatus Paceibacterota bacterium]